ncbi:MAG: peptidoglycan DD-metalloendopeptidase family protein [Oscillospiraceae bacterium]|jgi:murein DD-endopeptidase MepM/ murein hydrolase activator NlpD
MSDNSKKNNSAGKAGRFMSAKGFYIALVLCIAVIGLSGWYLWSSLHSLSEPAEIAETAAGAEEGAEASAAAGESVEAVTPAEIEEGGIEADAEDASEAESPIDLNNVFVWPVAGENIGAYSAESLMYNETLSDWRTHSGIDIAAEKGTPVVAMTTGVVTRIWEDPSWGYCLEMDHANTLYSRYFGLGENPVVQVGQTVLTGEVIGSVGATPLAESDLGSHLHFELELQGRPIDPTNYLGAIA